jgi:subtilisin family serine protease
VVGTGVDVTHPALAAHLWTNAHEIPGNGVDDDGDGIVDDVHGANFTSMTGDTTDGVGHGTHVAGIVESVDPRAQIMVLKATQLEGIDPRAAAAAIRYAVAHGARIVTLSWGDRGDDPVLADAIRYAAAHDVLLVAAAGNFTWNNDERRIYPASYAVPTLLAVAATCDGRTLAPFSDYGKGSVALAAPGCDVRSTLPGGGYGTLSGTSMAVPAVAGTAALLLESHPHATARELMRAILHGARPEPALGATLTSGAVLDVAGAQAAIAAPDRTRPGRFAVRSPRSAFTAHATPLSAYAHLVFRWRPSRDDDLAGYRLVVDGNVVATLAPTTTSLAEDVPPGLHMWSVVAYDRGGNARPATPRN